MVRMQYCRLLLLIACCLQFGNLNLTRLKVDSAFHLSVVGKMRTQIDGGNTLTVNHLERAVKHCEVEKVMLGTDYPFPLGEHEPGKLIDSMEDFDEQLKEKLKSGNALSFLNIDRKQFD